MPPISPGSLTDRSHLSRVSWHPGAWAPRLLGSLGIPFPRNRGRKRTSSHHRLGSSITWLTRDPVPSIPRSRGFNEHQEPWDLGSIAGAVPPFPRALGDVGEPPAWKP